MGAMGFSMLDRLWGRITAKHPGLDHTPSGVPEATHVHHSFITVLLFGSLGYVGAILWHLYQWHGHSSLIDLIVFAPRITGMKIGIVAGLVFYLCREIAQAINEVDEYGQSFFAHFRWDGTCDILLPCWVTLPIIFQSFALLWWLSFAVMLMYVLLRPRSRFTGGGQSASFRQ